MRAVRFFLCAGLALLTMGCLAPVPDSAPGEDERARAGLAAFFARPGTDADQKRPPLRKASLAGGDVVVSGPDGYCIDPRTKSAGPERGFALIASCRILTGGTAGRNVAPMLVTVTVGPRGDNADLPTPEALASASGAVLVSWKVSAESVTVHLASGGEAMFDGSDPRYWRSAFLQGDRVVGLALYAPRGSALAGETGAKVLAQVREIIARNSGQPQRDAAATSPKPGAKRDTTLFGRLFNR